MTFSFFPGTAVIFQVMSLLPLFIVKNATVTAHLLKFTSAVFKLHVCGCAGSYKEWKQTDSP